MDYSLSGKVIIYMVDYIGNIIDKISEETKGESATLAAHHLLDIAGDATKLS